VIEEYPETDAATKALAHLQGIFEDIDRKDLADLAGKALAVRQTAKPTLDQAPVDQAETAPPPEVDPLLALVTALKKQEEEDRRLGAHPPGSEEQGTTTQTPTQREVEKEMEKIERKSGGQPE